jgi:HemY protein
MTRLILILIMAGLVATGVAWLADNDGVATIAIAGYEFSTRASAALVLALILAAVLAALMRLAFVVFGRPSQFGSWAAERKAKQFFQALSHGLIAAASGDAAEAGHFGRRSDKLLKEQPLGLLLNAQAAQLAGEDEKEGAAYSAMLRYPETEFLGLRGLYTLAMRHHDEDQALAHAIRAYALKPKAWAMNALFDLRVSRREWREAATLVMQATRAKVLTADVARRRRAVLLAAQAVEAERTGDAAAQSHALEALALAPGLTAAALIAVRHLTGQGRAWKAQDIIEAAWSQTPHRELAEIYAAIRPEDDRDARAVHLIGLAKLNPGHRESRVLMAEQFVALRQWDEARNVLTPLAEDFSSARVCNLMAMIANGEQDVLTAQLWRSRAARAGRVADWRCVQCSSVAPEWAAVCPTCGAFDSLNWSAPEISMLGQGPRQIAASVKLPIPSQGTAPAVGVIVDATARSRGSVSSYRTEETATRFLRLPDDPGPGGPADIFEVDVEEGGTKTTRQKSG